MEAPGLGERHQTAQVLPFQPMPGQAAVPGDGVEGRRGSGVGWQGTPRPAGARPRSRLCPQVHGQVLYTASHDGALRLWDVRGLPAPRPVGPKRSLSRLFSNKVGCTDAPPLQPA